MGKTMEGKKGLIMGVANEKSSAWEIAKRLDEEGAKLGFTYQNEEVGKKALPLFEEIGAEFYTELDVTDDDNFEQAFKQVEEAFDGELDFIVHAIAGGPSREDLKGMYKDTSRESFLRTMEISAYSFVKAVQMGYPMMKGRDATAITLSYYGAEKVVPNYNVMGVAKSALESSVRYLADDLGSEGIRVNALSPGPMLTRAASGISDFRKLLRKCGERASMERLVEKEEVASSALYLLSDLSSGVTGEVIHVDCGFSIQA